MSNKNNMILNFKRLFSIFCVLCISLLCTLIMTSCSSNQCNHSWDFDYTCEKCGAWDISKTHNGSIIAKLDANSNNDGFSTLLITGSGEMYDFFDETEIPWTNKKQEISSVSFEGRITNISKRAFKNCTNLTSVTLSDYIEDIGAMAFDNCTSLTSISTNNVKNIGD